MHPQAIRAKIGTAIGSLTLVQKIALGLSAVLLSSLLIAGVVYRALLVAQDALNQVTETATPAAAAAYEMKINVVETGLKVLEYLDLGEPYFRAGAHEDMDDFDRFRQRYAELARTDKDRALAEQARTRFADLRALSQRLMDTAAARRAQVARIAHDLQQLDNLIDNELRPAIDPASARAAEKSHVTLGLEVNAAEVGAALGYYIREATPAHRALIFDNAGEFDRDLESLRALPLTAPERALAEKIAAQWRGVRARLDRVVALKDETDRGRDLARFLALHAELVELIDKGIQAHAVTALATARHDARAAQAQALTWLIAMIALSVMLSLAVFAGIMHAVRRPLEQLLRASEEFGYGNLDYRLPGLGDRELDRTASGFNRMAAQLQETMVSKEALRESEKHLRTVIDTNPECIKLVDKHGRLIDINAAGLAMIEAGDLAQVVGQSIDNLILPGYRAAFRALTKNVLKGNEGTLVFELEGLKGTHRWLETHAVPMTTRDGETVLLGTTRDITERKKAERQLEHQTLYDTLTDLPNRYLLNDRLTQAILAAARGNGMCALLVLDLDNFKEINDTLGHTAGDMLLEQIGSRLRGCIRATDTLARPGGDEFAIVLPDTDAPRAERVARNVLEALDAPFDLADMTMQVNASIGIAQYPHHGQLPEELLRQADVAMYTAKHDRSGYALYAPEHDPHSRGRLILSGELRRAIERDELVLHYQPKLRLREHGLLGMEALVRWRHPSRGLIPPDAFITHAESHGVIKPLTLWVLEAAARQWAAWRALGLEIPIAVNLSAVTLRDASFLGQILAILDRVGESGAWLELEVTETALMENPRLMLERLRALRARGVRLGIDDFGTGYSSLAYLRKFQTDTLKIDRSFIHDLTTNENNAMIVRAIIQLAHNLGIEVVAEGVEDQETCDRLRVFNCDAAQGYHLARPMPAADCLRWVDELLSAPPTAHRRETGP